MTDGAAAPAAPAPGQSARGRTPIQLSSGRLVVVEVPLPMSAEEVLELIVLLPGIIGNLNLQAVGQVAGRVALPSGGSVVVARPDRPA